MHEMNFAPYGSLSQLVPTSTAAFPLVSNWLPAVVDGQGTPETFHPGKAGQPLRQPLAKTNLSKKQQAGFWNLYRKLHPKNGQVPGTLKKVR